jgi:nucleoside-diphosphate-sugar epimerase
MTTNRVLVLGGAGFLGSHLWDRLLSRGHEVVAMDNLQTGSRENVAHLRDERRFTFVEHDVVEPFFAPCARIYNLACPASPPRYQRDPVKTTPTSVLGTLHAHRLARRCGACVFFASTSAEELTVVEVACTLGFSPRVRLEEGLDRTIAWFERSAAKRAEPSSPRLVARGEPRTAADAG